MYGNFAYIYDRLMQDVPYHQWLLYLERLVEKFAVPKGKALDLGCGTGAIAIPLAQKGWQVTAVDLSGDMLAVAEAKAREHNLDIRWVQQDMLALELMEKYSLVISMCDSLNYILSIDDLTQVFKHVNTYLEADGLFIFDLNSRYKLAEVFGDNVFTLNEEDVAYIWENYFDVDTHSCQMDITFFVKDHNGLFQRFHESHQERGYTLDEIKNSLLTAGLELIACFGEQTFEQPPADCERIYFLARKI